MTSKPIIAASKTQAHKAKVKALATITGPKIAAAVAAHLDDAGADALVATLRGMPLDRRQLELAELQSWSAKVHREEKP